ncbi:MAG: DUF6916 family protein [Pyrinomonadaceae bacterium]
MSVIAEKLPTKVEFSDSLDTIFHTQMPDGTGFDLCLVGFEDVVSNSVQENFTLLFRAPLDAPQVQSIYRLHHDKLGAMDIFLVPVKKDEDGLYFEAVFNLIKQAAA